MQVDQAGPAWTAQENLEQEKNRQQYQRSHHPQGLAALVGIRTAQVAVNLAAGPDQQQDQQEQHGDNIEIAAACGTGYRQQQAGAQRNRQPAGPGRHEAQVGEQHAEEG